MENLDCDVPDYIPEAETYFFNPYHDEENEAELLREFMRTLRYVEDEEC